MKLLALVICAVALAESQTRCENNVLLQWPKGQKGQNGSELSVTGDDHCKDKSIWCSPSYCWWKSSDCPASCAEECQPCIDESWYCTSLLCPITREASCRKTCAPRCQVDCKASPDLGECRAREVACKLSDQMEAWTSNNADINLVKQELEKLCHGGKLSREQLDALITASDGHGSSMDLPAESELIQDVTVSTALETSTCDGGTEDCTPDVDATLSSKSPLVKHALKAPKWLAKSGVDTVKEILKAGGTIALRGTIAFAFVSAGVSSFFPQLFSDPKSPCEDYADTDWAKCVWAQILRLVEAFVDAKIDDFVTELWNAKIKGYYNKIWYINKTVVEKTGELDEMPEDTVIHMVRKFERELHQKMIADAPQFMMPFSEGKAAGLFFSQFASLHFSIITTILSGNEFRTNGFRSTSQEIMLCYAQQAVRKTLQAREARLKALEVKKCEGDSICCAPDFPPMTCPQPCFGVCREYEDTWQNCGWSPGKCNMKTSCGPASWPLPWSCLPKEDTCPSSTEGKRWECHVNFVSQQMDQVWSTWLAPVPFWLQWIGNLDAMEVKHSSIENSNFYCPLD